MSTDVGPHVTRSPEQRKSDALAKLTANNTNVWVASASSAGAVHLVPVSHTWNGSQVVVATEPTSRTVINVTENGRVRLALGDTRDVVVIDAALAEVIPTADAPAPSSTPTALRRAGTLEPIAATMSSWCSRPERIEVWKESEDLAGRTVMRDGSWVI